MSTLGKFVPMHPLWLSIILCLGLAHPTYAATIFSEDYEVANLAGLEGKGWTCLQPGPTPSCSAPGTTNIVSSTKNGLPPHGGSHMLRQDYVGVHVNDCCNSWIMKTFTGVPEFYERYYVYFEAIDPSQTAGFSAVTAKQHYYNVASVPDMVSNFLFNSPEIVLGNQGTSHSCPPPPGGSGVVDSTCNLRQNVTHVPMTFNTWHCVEFHLGQTIAEGWVDGGQTLAFSTNLQMPTLWDKIQIYRQGSDNLYRYEDDYVVSTTRVGCSASTGDTNPPAAPIGLTLR